MRIPRPLMAFAAILAAFSVLLLVGKLLKRPATHIVTEFLEHLESRDFRAAYGLLAPDRRNIWSYEEFVASADYLELTDPLEVTLHTPDTWAGQACVRGRLRRPEGDWLVEFYALRGVRGWGIMNFATMAPGTPEDTLILGVCEGAEFR